MLTIAGYALEKTPSTTDLSPEVSLSEVDGSGVQSNRGSVASDGFATKSTPDPDTVGQGNVQHGVGAAGITLQRSSSGLTHLLGPQGKAQLETLPGFDGFAVVDICPQSASTPAGRDAAAQEMIDQLAAHPSLKAVVGLVPDANGNTELVVASRSDAASGSRLEGIYDIVARLAGSPAVKESAAQNPTPFTPISNFDPDGMTQRIRLPGAFTAQSLSAALAEGCEPNALDQLINQVKGLPQGQRVVLCIGGPSASGKSSLIRQIQEYAGDRKVVPFPGDMFFRDADDAKAPLTPEGTVYWDHPQAMNMDEMAGAIAQLIREGQADIPVYDFGATRPGGWERPDIKSKGCRTGEVTPTSLDADDILVIDSIHAMNPMVIDKLQALGLPHASVYLDSVIGEDRLVRRLVRDYATRGRSPQETFTDWDATTFPGEVSFVRPTLMELDPAQDVFVVRKFPADVGLSREAIDRKVELFEGFGLRPTYEAFATPDDEMEEFARAEAARFEAVLDDPDASADVKTDAQNALTAINDALESADFPRAGGSAEMTAGAAN